VVNVDLLTEVQGAKDVGDVVKVLNRFAKPFGDVQTWRFTRDRENNELRVFIALEQAARHKELAGRLGGCILGPEVCFVIPIYTPFDTTMPFAPVKPAPGGANPSPSTES
jgi:hypothetical protein